jgi:hypothetical protein
MVLAVVLAVAAACGNSHWSAAAPGASMKAAFEANPKLYFELLRSAGARDDRPGCGCRVRSMMTSLAVSRNLFGLSVSLHVVVSHCRLYVCVADE